MTEISDIQAIVGALAEPKNYYSGADCIFSGLPRQVLLFHRARQLEPYPIHHHRFVLISCLAEPGGVIVDSEHYRLEPGQGILIFPFQMHCFTRIEQPERMSWLFVTFESQDGDALQPLRNTPFTHDSEALTHLECLSRRFVEREPVLQSEVATELAGLLVHLVARQLRYLERARRRSPGPRADDFVQRISSHVFQHLDSALAIDDLARQVALSPSRLRARFKEEVGISLGVFIRRTRVHRACALLHSTNHPVAEIAEACGFSSVYSFSRTFRQAVGKSPTAFRNDVRGRDPGP